jgi:hypothetical protein
LSKYSYRQAFWNRHGIKQNISCVVSGWIITSIIRICYLDARKLVKDTKRLKYQDLDDIEIERHLINPNVA